MIRNLHIYNAIACSAQLANATVVSVACVHERMHVQHKHDVCIHKWCKSW